MQRPILFVISVILLVWAFMQGSTAVIVYTVLFLLAVGIILEVWVVGYQKHRRSAAVTKFLEDGKVDQFLSEIDKDIEEEKAKNYRDMLFVNKSAGLYYKGRQREGLALLDQVNVPKLPKMFQRLYYNNRIANLILDERYKEAQELADKNPQVFKSAGEPAMIDIALQGNLACLAFHHGDLETSRKMFERFLKLKRPRFYAASTHLYLGSIDLKEGKVEDAQWHFKEAIQAAPHTYISERAERLISYT